MAVGSTDAAYVLLVVPLTVADARTARTNLGRISLPRCQLFLLPLADPSSPDPNRFGGPGIKKKACLARICTAPREESAESSHPEDDEAGGGECSDAGSSCTNVYPHGISSREQSTLPTPVFTAASASAPPSLGSAPGASTEDSPALTSCSPAEVARTPLLPISSLQAAASALGAPPLSHPAQVLLGFPLQRELVTSSGSSQGALGPINMLSQMAAQASGNSSQSRQPSDL